MAIQNFRWLLLIVLRVNASTSIQIQQDDANSSILVAAVCKIIGEVYLQRNLTVYITLEESANLSKKMETFDLINSVIKLTPDNTKFQIVRYDKLRPKPRYFNIFFVESYESFAKISKLITAKKFDYKGKFLFVFTKNIQNAYEDIKKLITELWNKFIADVVVLIKSLNENKVQLYAFFPFTKHYCGEVLPVVWKTFANGSFQDDKPFFPRKFNDLAGCPLNVATFNSSPFMTIRIKDNGKISFRGLDGKLLTTIAKNLNFRINLTYMVDSEPQWGVIYPNGSSNGAMKKVRFYIFK